MYIKMFFKLILALVILGFFCDMGRGDDLIQVPAAIQISSTVSDGKYSISEIVKIAKDNGVKVVILTDRDFMRWQYGLWPLRRVAKKTVESNSVFNYGIKRYLKEIEDTQEKNPDMALIGGVIALVLLLLRKRVREMLKRTLFSMLLLRYGVKLSPASNNEAITATYPYGVAIAGGSVLGLWLKGWGIL